MLSITKKISCLLFIANSALSAKAIFSSKTKLNSGLLKGLEFYDLIQAVPNDFSSTL